MVITEIERKVGENKDLAKSVSKAKYQQGLVERSNGVRAGRNVPNGKVDTSGES